MTTKTDEQEREAFDKFMSDDGKFPQAIERDASGNYMLIQAASSWHVWKARAAIQSQDREDAERLDWIEKNARRDPDMGGNHTWWPTSFNKAIRGPSLREAIDHARRIEGEGE